VHTNFSAGYALLNLLKKGFFAKLATFTDLALTYIRWTNFHFDEKAKAMRHQLPTHIILFSIIFRL